MTDVAAAQVDDQPFEVYGDPAAAAAPTVPASDPDADGDRTDGLDYRGDGSIVARWTGPDRQDVVYRLRPPFLDELFDLWQKADEITAAYGVDSATRQQILVDYSSAVAAYQQAQAEYEKAVTANDATPGPPPIAPDAPFGPDFQRKVLQANSEWVTLAFETLATPRFEAVRRPNWFGNGSLITRFVQHWQQVPLGPGAPVAGQ